MSYPALPSPLILTLNVGSSSLKTALFTAADQPQHLHSVLAERIGSDNARLTITASDGTIQLEQTVTIPDHAIAFSLIAEWLDEANLVSAIAAIAHRIVHGGTRFTHPTLLTPSTIAELESIVPLDPDHLPQALATLAAARSRFPDLPQIGCFDTAFHQTMPAVARTLPIPHRFAKSGLIRFGFHGLSYQYSVEELRRLDALPERLIVAHLGSGSSLCAIRDGASIDTTMGFTPTGGVMMGTRSGDLDPGVIFALHRQFGMTVAEIESMLNKESGLLGLSGSSADTRDLLAAEASEPQAALAIAGYCASITKIIGAYAAILGGVDTVVFTGGVGEHAAVIRERVCAPLGFLGIDLNPEANAAHHSVISRSTASVAVRVIPSDENRVLAASALPFIQNGA